MVTPAPPLPKCESYMHQLQVKIAPITINRHVENSSRQDALTGLLGEGDVVHPVLLVLAQQRLKLVYRCH